MLSARIVQKSIHMRGWGGVAVLSWYRSSNCTYKFSVSLKYTYMYWHKWLVN